MFQVLHEWRAYLTVRKHKNSRMEMAMDSYRQWVLREACCQWLATADSLSQMRAAMAARHQAKAAFDKFHLLQKYALHWKNWARMRSANRNSQVKRNITLTLASAVRYDKMPAIPIVSQTYSNQLQFVGHLEDKTRMKPQLSVTSPIQPFHQGKTQDCNRYSNFPRMFVVFA